MAGSVRDYAILWVGAGKPGSGGGGTALGGNALLRTAQHKLDGVEHLAADDTTDLDTSITAHGLMPKLSGVSTDGFHGDGTQGPFDHGGLTGLGDDDHPQYTTAAELAAYAQPLDSDLTAFAALAIAADKLPYGTGSHTLGLADLSAFIRTLLDDPDATTARATLGITGATTRWEPHVDYTGSVVLDGNGDPVMVEVAI